MYSFLARPAECSGGDHFVWTFFSEKGGVFEVLSTRLFAKKNTSRENGAFSERGLGVLLFAFWNFCRNLLR